ncbi:Ig-like domain-containing protein [Pontibacter arcticus]|uniref:PKD domain-containing protein n=1 Tax=Pontibacter arcticus TaxID=2080288 RepID=A0A364RJ89_9BACT|nr:gliding motility-associated C-terminal domain-containing protein [Pontibacter arcticus]RAU84343.1 hypothetical protein DP923_04710 [Pontibacter arcticus]
MHPSLRKLLFLLQLALLLLSVQQTYAQTCSAAISVDKVTICNGETAVLTGSAQFTITSWELFKDGVSERTNNTGVFSITQPGEYYAQATGSGCVAIRTNAVTVTVNDPPLQPVIVTNPPNPTAGDICGGDQILFSVQNPEDGVEYRWDFGDGTVATGATDVPHTYQAVGVSGGQPIGYTVRVQAVRTQGGCTNQNSIQVAIKQTPEVSFTETNNFQICLRDGLAAKDTTVFAEIQNTTQAPYLTDIATYFIDWGDGKGEVQYTGQPNPFPLKSPAPYDSLGNYPIRIRAVNNAGCDAATPFEAVFQYNKKPEANLTFNKEPKSTPQSCTPIIVALGDSSSGGGLSYKWTVKEPNNGGFSVEQGGFDQDTLRLLFETPGVFNIELIVSNSCGSDTTEQSVIVGYPQAQLAGDITVCGETTIKYDAQTVFYDPNFGNTVTYQWFVDGQPRSTAQYPEFNFPVRATPYRVEVKVTNECGASDDIGPVPPQLVTVNPPAAAPVVENLTACTGDQVTITPSGPGPAYNFYDANNPDAVPLNAAPALSFTTPALTVGATYYVETITAQGCASDRVAVVITVNPPIADNTIQEPAQPTVCIGNAPTAPITGSTPSGGDTYTWIFSTTGPDAGFVAAPGPTASQKDYTPPALTSTTWFRRIVSGAAACKADTSNAVQLLAVPPIQNNNIISGNQEICQGEQPNPVTGTPVSQAGAIITWEISTVSATEGFVSAPAPNNAQDYTFGAPPTQEAIWVRRVVNLNGCSVPSAPIKISVFPRLANNTIGDPQDICIGEAPKPLIGTGDAPTGGNGRYDYIWQSSTSGPNDDASFVPATGTNNAPSYTPGTLQQTTWFRRILSARGANCSVLVSNVIEITVTEAITNNTIISPPQEVCEGTAPETILGSQASGGTGWQWEISNTSATSGFFPAPGASTNPDYSPEPLLQNTWFRRIVLAGGCSDTSAAILVTVVPKPVVPTLTARNVTSCVGGSVTLSVANPVAGIVYKWFTEETAGTQVGEGPQLTIPGLTQTITYYVEAQRGNDGCVSSARAPVTVNVVASQANAGEDATIIQGRPIELRATGGDTFRWEPATGLSDPNVANPVATPTQTTTYTVTTTSQGGCISTDEVTITVIPAIVVRNAFSPNQDNVNEVWEIENIGKYPEARVEVFNRWGNLVFSSDGYAAPWDGTRNGSELPVATYYYIIYLNKTDKPISGNVTILR